VLDQLFSASMEQSNMRIDAPYNLAIKLQDEAQNAVRRRVLRPKIYREVPAQSVGHNGLDCCKANSASIGKVPAQVPDTVPALREIARVPQHPDPRNRF
jgi:hypothetical protein